MARNLQTNLNALSYSRRKIKMPELPEVETIKRYVESALKGAQIQNVQVRQPKFREPVPDDFAQKNYRRRNCRFKTNRQIYADELK